uniref:RELT like 2 n=1 Tax=Laticauda laticaudata TaxID=8630 RepID=A0A8C5RE58_LATLA
MNEDTVEKIVKCIIQNEANVEVLKEMLGESDADLPLPVPVPSSHDGGIPHHHTVHLGSTQAPCIHCSKKKRPPIHRQGRSKESKSKMHPGETTVFSVGSFELTHNKYLMKYRQSNSIRFYGIRKPRCHIGTSEGKPESEISGFSRAQRESKIQTLHPVIHHMVQSLLCSNWRLSPGTPFQVQSDRSLTF